MATTFVAPASLLSALLFYFGYVFSRAQYAYFGVDVDAIGLSTRDYVMRSPQALLVPLLVIALGGTALLVAHLALRSRDIPLAVVRATFVVAAVVLLAGLVLLFGYEQYGGWGPYGAVTPLLITTGVALAAYAARWPAAPGFLAGGKGTGPAVVRRGALMLALVVIATCLFWATATLAEWTGRGTAKETARELDQLPLVILDTQERLFLTDGVVEESVLPTHEGQTFRYRYRRLRLLVQGDERMFLVPDQWTASNSALAVSLDGSVRVQFRFINDPP
ncbi:MAG: hypothetical protein GEU81_04050 [Nitriliruptorales bacterium]|nr:hypothetical protein [Nitriliruptorales bacterium]